MPKLPIAYRRQVYAVEESNDETDEEAFLESEVAAFRQGSSKFICWNCDVEGHSWENCLGAWQSIDRY